MTTYGNCCLVDTVMNNSTVKPALSGPPVGQGIIMLPHFSFLGLYKSAKHELIVHSLMG